MDIDLILVLIELGCLWLLLAVLGLWILFRTHQVINIVYSILEKFPFYNADDYPNLSGEMTVFFYRLIAVSFILIPLIPLIVIIQDCILREICGG